jgi:cell division septum initiation protein DivIVA
MPRGRSVQDLATLQMALVGYQIERQKIDDKIREIESRLKGRLKSTSSLSSRSSEAARKAPKTRRTLSAAARRRIAAAQKKRWAEHRKRMAQAAKQG